MEKRRILVVEDDPDVLAVMVRHLELRGYTVIEANDGMEGLEKLKNGGYDMVITDIVMPFVSGLGIVSAAKSSHPGTPVIAITGYGKEPESAAIESNADLVLSKPIKMAELLEHINRLFQEAQ